MATSGAPLAHVTVQVRAMRKAGRSERGIAAELGTTRNVIHTILTKGAEVTRGKAKRALLRWLGGGRRSAPMPATMAPSPARRQRRRRGNRVARSPRLLGGGDGGTVASLEMDGGRIIHVQAGTRYVIRRGALYQSL